jgi:hypothetical protein
MTLDLLYEKINVLQHKVDTLVMEVGLLKEKLDRHIVTTDYDDDIIGEDWNGGEFYKQ